MMSDQPEFSEAEIREMDKKTFRKKAPSGWMEVSRYETLALVLDALLGAPPTREFTVGELADHSGASERGIRNRINSLVHLGVITELEDREPVRYSINSRSPITQKLYELNSTVERVKEESLPKTLCSPPRHRFVDMDSNRWNETRNEEDISYDLNEIAAAD